MKWRRVAAACVRRTSSPSPSSGDVLALALALAIAPPAPSDPPVWRLVNHPGLHVGARPAALVTSDGPEVAAGATLQVTLRTPW